MSAQRNEEGGDHYSLKSRQPWFGEINVKPVCAFRIVIGAILAYWYIDLLPDIDLFFSDSGWFPKEVLQYEKSPFVLSPLDWVSGDWWPKTFFALGALSAVLLLLGWQTRIAAVVSFICLVTIQHRNLLPWDGSDAVIRVTCFWLMFCPIERSFSLDAWIASRRGIHLPVYAPAIGIRLLQLQVACIYLVTGWAKLHGLSWLDGTALHYVLNLGPAWNRMLAPALSDWPLFLMLGTVGTLLLELLFVPLIFSPWFQPRLKILALLWGTVFHVLIVLTLKVNWFSYAMLATYIVFFEPEWVEKIERALKTLSDKLITSFPITFTRINNCAKPTASPPSVEGYEGKALTETRYPQLANGGAKFWAHFLLIALFALAVRFSLDPTSKAIRKAIPFPPAARNLVQLVGLEQSWGMFAPRPHSSARYVILEGELPDGRIVRLLESGYGQGGWNPRKPYYDGWYYSRWTQIFSIMTSYHTRNIHNPYVGPFSAGICRSYNGNTSIGEPPLNAIKMIMMRRETSPPGEPEQEWNRQEVYYHRCS